MQVSLHTLLLEGRRARLRKEKTPWLQFISLQRSKAQAAGCLAPYRINSCRFQYAWPVQAVLQPKTIESLPLQHIPRFSCLITIRALPARSVELSGKRLRIQIEAKPLVSVGDTVIVSREKRRENHLVKFRAADCWRLDRMEKLLRLGQVN
jgi:hypothetical protein